MSKNPADRLPDDLLICTCALAGKHATNRFACSSRACAKVVTNQDLWQRFLEREWNDVALSLDDWGHFDSWKTVWEVVWLGALLPAASPHRHGGVWEPLEPVCYSDPLLHLPSSPNGKPV